MVKQPQENTDFHQSDSIDDNLTLYNHPVDDAFSSDNQLKEALKEGKSIYQIKDLLKPSGKPTVTAATARATSSSSQSGSVAQTTLTKNLRPKKILGGISQSRSIPVSNLHTLERVPPMPVLHNRL